MPLSTSHDLDGLRRHSSRPDRDIALASSQNRKARRPRALRLNLDALENRQLMTIVPGAIVPGQLYQDVAFYDASGDTVEIRMDGPTTGVRGFTLRLAGEATGHADVQTLNLIGLTAENGLSVIVTPNELIINAGPDYNKMFSAGYTNVASITADAGVTALGSVNLSAAIVDDVALPAVAVGNITLDTGMVTYVDRVNTSVLNSMNISAPVITITSPITGEAEIFDESPVGSNGQYNPCAGLIDLWDVEALSVGSIVVNGSISATTSDTYDATQQTNDLRGVIDVSGEIGSIVAPRSAMRNAIRAGGVGSIRLGRIDGEITTRDAAQAMTIALPSQFTGFLHAAGHLNVGFTSATAELATGNIWAGGGISGTDPSEGDPILVPDKYAAAVVDASPTKGIADVEVNGAAMSRWISASSIGKVTALTFDAGASFEAATDIGGVEMLMPTAAGGTTANPTRTPADMEGFFKAGRDIGDVKSASGVKAQLIAGRNIGKITGVAGGLESTVVLAGGDVGDISVYQTTASTTQISAGGDIGDVRVYSGSVGWRVKARNIGDVLVDAGSLNLAVFVAAQDLGSVTVTSPDLAAIEGGSLIAGRDMGQVTAYAFAGTGIHGTLIQAGRRIAGVSGTSYGSLILPTVTAGATTDVAAVNNGIDAAQILAPAIGPILGQAYVGTGLYKVVVHAQTGDVDSITGVGNGDGIFESIVVAEGGIGPITGRSTVLGRGIEGGSFDANGKTSAALGKIGQVTAEGGPAGGHGIELTRFQASNRIAGIDATANANGGDAMNGVVTYAVSYGPIKALVLGGQTGNGIVDASLRAWSDYENARPDVQVDSIHVDVRSALGMGISGSIFQIKGDLTDLESKAMNAAAISTSRFSLTQGDFGRIDAASINGGTAIDSSEFVASNGSITSARDLASAATSGITATASGTSALAHAISGSTFLADGNIGVINATTRGGTAILDSIFVADSDYGNSANGPNLSGGAAEDDDLGTIFGVYAKTSGQALVGSAGIFGSSFEAEHIAWITVEVTDREEGGAGISGSIFNARNAVYDGAGAFDNKGSIGPITVTDGSLRGDGIENSQFYAGAAGSIGDITVTTLGGVGILGSEFRASSFDYDQKHFTGTIGDVRVTTGRAGGQAFPLPPAPNDAWTLLPAGISGSYFAADAGIGDVDVNALGTGVFFSAFLADFDAMVRLGSIPGFILPILAEDVPGDLGNVAITSNGRFGFGSVFSLYTGENVGNVTIRVSSRETQAFTLDRPDLATGPVGAAIQGLSNIIGFAMGSRFGPAASAGSAYVATGGNIGRIDVANLGAGFDSLGSAYVALPLGFYGPVSRMDAAWGNFFWGIPRLFAGSAPSVAGSAATSVAPAFVGTYKAGDGMFFKVGFSNPVDVSGKPRLQVNVGSTTRWAEYVSGGGTSELLFCLVVQPGDSGDVTIPAGASIQTDVGDHIAESSTGLALTQLTPAAIGFAGVRVGPAANATPVDATAPVVVGVSAIQSSARKYAEGVVLTIQITFSEAVSVRGLPTVPLTFGTLSRSFVYSGGDGTNTLVFRYTLTRADVASRKTAATSGQILLPAGASIADLAGNLATFPAAQTASTQVATSVGKKPAVVRTNVAHPRGPAAVLRPASRAVRAG
ncbi:beta strand repeat-containing protein [Paludisphaera mucosa]|uniref:Uncharacterized protein n=1 Tax=Paludisphaera mucosa TaxID=3030827 RepID=A0ABT6FKE6_9BACT|nr:hypothetical protein [Paludisphaera mucosa]MDG3008046.1 hypothetical protein [Paludisphaera mucosa]